jgi:hypothetical protein
VEIYAGGSIFLLVSALDSLVGKVAAHEGLLEGSKDFFGEVLDYDGITINILRGFNRFMRGEGRGGVSNKNFIKKKKKIFYI